MAAVGALLISSGISLMATPTPATAGNHENLKDWVCKYVGTPGVDEHLKQGNDGLVWVDTHATQGTWFNDAHGRSYVLRANAPHSPRPSSSQCPVPDITYATASVTWTDPSCDNENTASYETSGEHVVFKVKVKDGGQEQSLASGTPSVSPGDTVHIMALALHGYRFEGGAKVKFFEHEFSLAEVNCTEVSTLDPTFVDPTCTALTPSVTLPQVPAEGPVKYTLTGDLVAGATVHVTATLVDAETTHFAEGAKTSWDHTFTVPTGCTTVSPPAATTQVSPPKAKAEVKAKVKATTPTVVHAGLAGDSASSSDVGLGLAGAGLLLLVGAGGLVLARAGRRTTA